MGLIITQNRLRFPDESTCLRSHILSPR
eukprot:COSAG01_NODE_53147_length_341_cov_0.842975_1_plen_27_part_10